MKDIFKNRRRIMVSFFACVSIFTFFFLVFFFLGNNLIRKFYFDTFIPIFFLSALLTVFLYSLLSKYKILLRLVAIPGMLLFILVVIALIVGAYFPRQRSKEYIACRETAYHSYDQALKEKGYPKDVGIDDLKKGDQHFWIEYLDELPKCDKYK